MEWETLSPGTFTLLSPYSHPLTLSLTLHPPSPSPSISLSLLLSPPAYHCPLRWYRGHSDYVRGLAWVEDGTSSSLITGSWDKTVQVWDKSAAAADVEAQPTP